MLIAKLRLFSHFGKGSPLAWPLLAFMLWPGIAVAQSAPAPEKADSIDWMSRIQDFARGLTNQGENISLIVTLAVIFVISWLFLRSTLFKALRQTFLAEFLSNWRLVLLGITGVVLSIASGWTTWDGMTNFTGNPILSLLITFGIQGVMLIAAWLIGETFAEAGSRWEPASENRTWRRLATAIAAFVVLALAGFVIGLVYVLFTGDPTKTAEGLINLAMRTWTWGESHQNAIVQGLIITGIALLILFAIVQREIVGPYVRGAKVILKNLPVWIMFLSCMATSVFFSFDSLFSTIFPENERARAADLRTRNQVAGIVSDVGTRLAERRSSAIDAFFRSEIWARYDGQLSSLVQEARRAPDLVESRLRARLEARAKKTETLRAGRGEAHARIESLTDKRKEISARLTQLEPGLGPLRTSIAELNEKIRKQDQQIIAVRAELEAEVGGVGDTGRTGFGPKAKEINDRLKKLRIDLTALKRQKSALAAEFKALNGKIESAKSRIEAISVAIAKAQSRIKAADAVLAVEAKKAASAAKKIDPSGGLKALETARRLFRQAPSAEGLGKLQQYCDALLVSLKAVPETAARTGSVDCSPERVAEAGAPIFALSKTISAYQSRCGKSAALPIGTDKALEFGRGCVQLSALAGRDTSDFRARLGRAALNRDDKAHRFVVTINAFNDGNRLALLALAIALAIDGLVFMTGLFGARVLASPITNQGHASQVLEAALAPDRFTAARQVLGVMYSCHSKPGFSHELSNNVGEDTVRARIRRVLNAGVAAGLVTIDAEREEHYYTRPEFYEYLNTACQQELHGNKALARSIKADDHVTREEDRAEHLKRWARVVQDRAEHMRSVIEPALMVDLRTTDANYEMGKNAKIVIDRMQPVADEKINPDYSHIIVVPSTEAAKKRALWPFGGSARSRLPDIDDGLDPNHVRRVIHSVINAAAGMKVVMQNKRRPDEYFIRPGLYQALIQIRNDTRPRARPPMEERENLPELERAPEPPRLPGPDADTPTQTLLTSGEAQRSRPDDAPKIEDKRERTPSATPKIEDKGKRTPSAYMGRPDGDVKGGTDRGADDDATLRPVKTTPPGDKTISLGPVIPSAVSVENSHDKSPPEKTFKPVDAEAMILQAYGEALGEEAETIKAVIGVADADMNRAVHRLKQILAQDRDLRDLYQSLQQRRVEDIQRASQRLRSTFHDDLASLDMLAQYETRIIEDIHRLALLPNGHYRLAIEELRIRLHIAHQENAQFLDARHEWYGKHLSDLQDIETIPGVIWPAIVASMKELEENLKKLNIGTAMDNPSDHPRQ